MVRNPDKIICLLADLLIFSIVMAVHVYFVTARVPKAVRLKHALVELGVSSMILMFIRSGTLGENLTRKQVYDQREEKRTVGTTCITKKHCDCFLATVKVIETKS